MLRNHYHIARASSDLTHFCLELRTRPLVSNDSQFAFFFPELRISSCTDGTMPTPSGRSAIFLVAKIRWLLKERGLFLADVSRQSRSEPQYGRLAHIPHNLYDAIRRRQFSPSIFQVAALSRLSGYRFVDWLELFGFSLDHVPRFQASFTALRTVELDARIYHPRATVPWFRDVAPPSFLTPLVPLSLWLSRTEPRRADSLPAKGNSGFLFVKIGLEDAFAFPNLLPGSIVRVKPLSKANGKIFAGNKPGKNLFLVEQERGLICSQMHRGANNQITLCSKHLPYAPAELELGTQAAVLGAADVEIRRIVNIGTPLVPKSLGGYRKALPLPPRLPSRNVGEFLRRARKRSGLSFREASTRTRVIAKALHDARYFCAPGSLSDFETRPLPPRHIHKLTSICAVYFAGAAEFLEAAGVPLDGQGALPMPLHLLGHSERDKGVDLASKPSRFLHEMERRFRGLPYFLSGVLPAFFGMPDLSIRDVFWSGGAERFVHPYMKGAAFLVVDRKKKIPRSSLSCPKWAQPLYVFLRRDGSYLCGSCTRVNDVLAIHPCTAGLPKLLRLRNRTDAEVVGQVIGIVRRLP
jgi:hypothetical protein